MTGRNVSRCCRVAFGSMRHRGDDERHAFTLTKYRYLFVQTPVLNVGLLSFIAPYTTAYTIEKKMFGQSRCQPIYYI